jgi:NADH-quinone oxidoreductase subunit L
MPITAITMLVGVIAICGLAIPFLSFELLGGLIGAAAYIWLIVVAFRTSRGWGMILVLPFILLLVLTAVALVMAGGAVGLAMITGTAILLVLYAIASIVGLVAAIIFTIQNWSRAAIPFLGTFIGALIFYAIPGVAAFSGFHSKDAIVATSLAYTGKNTVHFLLFWIPLITAGITAFYMFRLWFYTFAGTPRDEELHSHVHESPWVMTGPLVLLAVFAAFCAIGGESGPLFRWLLESEPAGLADGVAATAATAIALPSHADVGVVHGTAGAAALLVAFAGTLIAFLLYGLGIVNPAEIKRQFSAVHQFLVEKWQFDTLYDAMFVRPVHIVASWCTWIDRAVFDGFLHRTCRCAVDVSRWDRKFDEGVVDGLVNLVGNVVFSAGRSLRAVQTGKLRQYVMFIAVGVLTLFVLLFAFFPQG